MVNFRIEKDDIVRNLDVSSVEIGLRIHVGGTWDNGLPMSIPKTGTSGSARTNNITDSAPAPLGGTITSAEVSPSTPFIKRGRTFCRLHLLRNKLNVSTLATGYIASDISANLGTYVEAGPAGGHGFKAPRAIADDVTPVDIQHTLGETRNLRRIDGFIWYYHCSSDVASRTLRASLRDLGDGLPTGMTSGGNTLAQLWPSAAVVTLTANEEGTIVVQNQFAVSVDNGSTTFEDPSARPNPFPYWAQENDVGEFFFDVTSANANDRHTIYIIQEEWIDP